MCVGAFVFICVRTLRAFKQLGKGKCDKFILTGHPDYEKNFWKIELNNFFDGALLFVLKDGKSFSVT